MKELHGTYMGVAIQMAKNSHATRKKVGGVVVTKSGVMLPGYNGTSSGRDNTCEVDDVTLPTVLHAELNCILKAAREGVSLDGATIYLTMAPCLPCAAMIEQVGISKVVYLEDYRLDFGVQYLLSSKKVTIERFENE